MERCCRRSVHQQAQWDAAPRSQPLESTRCTRRRPHLLVLVPRPVPQPHPQQRHPWSVKGQGTATAEAIVTLLRGKLGGLATVQDQPTKQKGCWHTYRPGCTLPHCRAAPGSAPLPRPPCCMRTDGRVGNSGGWRLAARAAGCASSVRPATGWAAAVSPMLALHTYSETRGGELAAGRASKARTSPDASRCRQRCWEFFSNLAEDRQPHAAGAMRREARGGDRSSCCSPSCGRPACLVVAGHQMTRLQAPLCTRGF